jgi:DNA polymerase
MTLSRDQMLVEMGISPLWVEREPGSHLRGSDKTPPIKQKLPMPAVLTRSELDKPAPIAPFLHSETNASVHSENWPKLTAQVAACHACPLSQQRKQAVLGVGDKNPDWLFVGERPGVEEDTQGEPFVGQAGKLLDNMLAALGVSRNGKVYISNAVKCRPPGNRTPEPSEVATCQHYLEQQIALLKPKIIVLLGKVAASSLLKEDKTLAAMRGSRFEYAGIPVVVTYHPDYLLRNLPDKAKAWEDLVFARRVLNQEIRQQTEGSLPF